MYAKDALTKVLGHQLALGKHASAMRTMDKLAGVYLRLKQPHNLTKLILSRVVLLLAAADPVAAQREYDRQLDAPGFSSAPEAEAAEDLLVAYGACANPVCAAHRLSTPLSISLSPDHPHPSVSRPHSCVPSLAWLLQPR